MEGWGNTAGKGKRLQNTRWAYIPFGIRNKRPQDTVLFHKSCRGEKPFNYPFGG